MKLVWKKEMRELHGEFMVPIHLPMTETRI